MCESISLSYNTFNSMLRRQSKNITLDVIESIALYFDISVDYLVRDDIIDVNYGKQSTQSNINIEGENLSVGVPYITDSSEEELVTTYRELNVDNKAYIRVRSKELLKDQISAEETKESDIDDIKTFKIASRNGKN